MAININTVINLVTKKIQLENVSEIEGFKMVNKVLLVNIMPQTVINIFKSPTMATIADFKINFVYDEFVLTFPLETVFLFPQEVENANRN